eukprot:Selendium_serpulae@DN742_c0_g1_i1.p1
MNTFPESGVSASLVRRKAPEFAATAVMPNGEFKDVSLSRDFSGKHVLLFFYPFDFTFVCPSEILAFNNKVDELKALGVELLGCSVDSQFVHAAWRNTAIENGGIGKIKFPLLADVTRKIARDYGVLLEEGMALRGLFIIDKTQTVRHALVNDLPLGRSVDEAIRLVEAMNFTDAHGEVCPANWKKGQKAMKPDAEGVAKYLKDEYAK